MTDFVPTTFRETGHAPLTGVLVIDPGWRTLGVLYLQVFSESKEVRKWEWTVDLGFSEASKGGHSKGSQVYYDAFDRFFTLDMAHIITSVEILVIEEQPAKFRQNRRLQELLEMFLQGLFYKLSIYRYSPLETKRAFGIAVTTDHDENKRRMMEFISDPSQKHSIVLWGTYNSHIADCVAIFNVFLRNHKLIQRVFTTYSIIIEDSSK